MGVYTQYTAAWLDRRYSKVAPNGSYFAHMPIYGHGNPSSEGGHPVRFGIVYRILRELARLDFKDLLVVGGGEGFVAHAAAIAFGVEAVDLDLSHESCARAFDAFEAIGVAADATRLPFADNSFDVVLCSEVIEHLEFPIEAMLELERVARRVVVLTTLEIERDEAAIAHHRFQRCGYPHFEQNLFAARDFEAIFGAAHLASTLRGPVPDAIASTAELRDWLRYATTLETLDPQGVGVTLVKELIPSRVAPRLGDEELLDALLVKTPVAPEAFAPRRRSRAPAELEARCVCPFTHEPLREVGGELVAASGRRYTVANGVPVLYDLEHPDPTEAELSARLAPLADPARIASLIALRRDLVGVSTPGRFLHDLTDREHRRNWRFGPNVAELHGVGRGLCLQALNEDPFVVAPVVALPCHDVASVRLLMRVHAPQIAVAHGTGQIFWLRERDDDFDESRSVRFPVANSMEVLEYRVDLAAALADGANTDQRLILFRIDPADGVCGIELLEFEVVTRT